MSIMEHGDLQNISVGQFLNFPWYTGVEWVAQYDGNNLTTRIVYTHHVILFGQDTQVVETLLQKFYE